MIMKIEEILNTTFKNSQQKVIVNIRHTANYLNNHQSNFMSDFNISMAQFNILRILRGAKGEINVNTVKDRMIEKSPNTTRLMDKLVQKGLINRENSSKDRRVVMVEITQKGLDLLSEIDGKLDGSKIIPQNFSNEDSEMLSNLLDKLRNSFEKK